MSKQGLHLIPASPSAPRPSTPRCGASASGVSIVTAGRGDDITGVTDGLADHAIRGAAPAHGQSRPPLVSLPADRPGSLVRHQRPQRRSARARRSFRHAKPVRAAEFEGIDWSRGAARRAPAAARSSGDRMRGRRDHRALRPRDRASAGPTRSIWRRRLSSLLYWNELYVEVDRNADLDLLAAGRGALDPCQVSAPHGQQEDRTCRMDI